ncbi:bifunctional (p)ppGpp synthetase/guanosine-3',5'-bis(diphosphate) 3'-pyrophosphohydrolase [Candidatus Tisiphia endosymbiont of Dioctria rufipes]|uniref:bifunctional (p)ppGpp synthetase/guanosine-3',5'-bis(diphosphate) 3'-pyrophosphohydrolase n=1 Tax=Candidatus Tisiphia endosymbiont of Dioctria rufipes TaxID=3066255 RepID=UPI00312C7DF2
MTYRYIIETLKKFDPDFDDGQVNRAINFALKHYGNNNNRSLEIAEIIISIYPDTNSVITSLLFFSLAKNHLKATKIKHYFGEEIVKIFDSLTKLFQMQHTYYHNTAQETFKLLLSLNPNIGIRVLLIRYAYLLHKIIFNFKVSDIEYYLISKEINEVYVPLFKEIKVEKIKTILQNVCLKILQPKLNKFIITFLEENYPNQEQLVIKIINAFHDILSGINIAYIISGRVKSPYSIARKIVQKSNETKRLFDIIGIRVIVEQEAECYKILDAIYNNYQHVPERHKDFIKLPKKNNYQSLHTIIIDRDSRKLEVQIRTKRMHYIAQFGTASHLQYKMQSIKSKNLDIAYSILNRFISDILNQFTIATMVHKSLRIDNRSAYLISDMIGIIKSDKRTLQQDVSSYQGNPTYYVDAVKIVNVNQEAPKLVSTEKPHIAIDIGKTSQFQGGYLVTIQTRYKYHNSIKNLPSSINKHVSYNKQVEENPLDKQPYIEKNLSSNNMYNDSKNSKKSNTLEALKKNSAIILEESNNTLHTDQAKEIKTVNTPPKNTDRSGDQRYLESDTRCRNEHNVASIPMSIKSDDTSNYIDEDVLVDETLKDNKINFNDQKTDYPSSSPKPQRTQEEKKQNTLSRTEDNIPNDSDNRNSGSDVSNAQKIVSQQENFKNIIIIRFVYDDNDIMNVRVEEFVSILKGTKITHLNFRDNYIGDTEIKTFASILKDTKITHLNLGHNYIGEIGVEILVSILKDTKITHLNLGHNYIGETGVEILASILKDTKITHLDLGSNEINDTGVDALASILKDTKITHLDLSCNNIGDTITNYEVNALASILKDTKITHLDLSCNNIGDTITNYEVDALASILKDTKITHLNLEYNKIGNTGVIALASILKNTKIIHLNLGHNYIGETGVEALASILKNNKITINFENQEIDNDMSSCYNSAFTKLQRIEEFLSYTDQYQKLKIANAEFQNTNWNEDQVDLGYETDYESEHNISNMQISIISDDTLSNSEINPRRGIKCSDSSISGEIYNKQKRFKKTMIIRLGYNESDIRNDEVEELISKLEYSNMTTVDAKQKSLKSASIEKINEDTTLQLQDERPCREFHKTTESTVTEYNVNTPISELKKLVESFPYENIVNNYIQIYNYSESEEYTIVGDVISDFDRLCLEG